MENVYGRMEPREPSRMERILFLDCTAFDDVLGFQLVSRKPVKYALCYYKPRIETKHLRLGGNIDLI